MPGQPSFPVDLGPVVLQTDNALTDYGRIIYDTEKSDIGRTRDTPSQPYIAPDEGFGYYEP